MRRGWLLIVAAALLSMTGPVLAQDESPGEPSDEPPPEAGQAQAEPEPGGPTPPRLSFMDGEVSFWRPGAEDWAPARANTPLAPGDSLYTGKDANLELQIGPQAFARAGAETELGLETVEPDFLQLKATSGHVSLDVRRAAKGHTIELDTPNAVFTIDRAGYYRFDVDEDTTTLVTRRGGRATMTPAGGEALDVAPSEQVVAEGTDAPKVETYAAPDLDDWDRWNYDRTDHLIDPASSRYVPQGVYGTDDLDHHGDWRQVPRYGDVWVPNDVSSDWAPYSAGRWIWDPYYGWTWIDDAPWGWAPYHYGRWVSVDGYWGWAPGPIVAAPVYAPALVAFFGAPGIGVSVGIGTPSVGWVALGWGEPVVAWWGPRAFVGAPRWCGWGGPHVVNNVVIIRTTIINARNINVFQNARVHNAIVAVRRDRFGTGADHFRVKDAGHWKPLHEPIRVKPTPASLVAASGRAIRPPEAVHARPVVATRQPHDPSVRLREAGLNPRPGAAGQAPRIVPAPTKARAGGAGRRPPTGPGNGGERRLPPPPRFERAERPAARGGAAGRPAGGGRAGERPAGRAGAGQQTGPGKERAARGPARPESPPPPSNARERPAGRGVQRERPSSFSREPAPAYPRQRPARPSPEAQQQPPARPSFEGQHQPPARPSPEGQRQPPARPSFEGQRGGARGLPGEPADRLRPAPHRQPHGPGGGMERPQARRQGARRREQG